MNFKLPKLYSLVFCLLIAVVILTSLPYFFAFKNCNPGNHFLGQIEYMPDQNMYFSFINQVNNGKLIFNNKLTSLANNNVFINVQFALVGILQRFFQLSSNWTYQLWRLLGIFCLVIAFYLLASMVFKNKQKRLLSLFLFSFGGGFSFLFLALFMTGLISRDMLNLFSIDLWSGILPFQQMITNPHFSFPHGIFLLGIVYYLAADKKNSLPLVVVSGVIFAIQGLIRPYDLISISAVISVFAIIEMLVYGFNLKILFLRVIPLFIIIPSFLYNVWLFKINSIFKYWSLQGHNADSDPMFLFQYLSYGIVGILALIRISFVKKQSLSKTDRFLLCWFVVIFALSQIGKIIPMLGFSPQLGVPLFGPLVLFSLGIEPSLLKISKNITRLGCLVLLLLTICYATTAIFYFSQRFLKGEKDNPNYYATINEFNAWQWIDKNISSGKIVIALPENALRISKYTKVQVPAAHYSVSPKFCEISVQVNKFYDNQTTLHAKLDILKSLNVEYIYVGMKEKKKLGLDDSLKAIFGKSIYMNDDVKIYHNNFM